MRRRSTSSSEPTKARRRKAAVRTRPNAPKIRGGRGALAPDRETEVARLTRELHEAQEQQTATAEVLKIISTSPTELQSVLEVVVRSAARFCQANDATIYELDGQDLRIAAHWGTVPQEVGIRFPCVRGQVAGRAVLERKPVHVIDLQAEAEEFPGGSAFARRLGHRTTASVPLLREGVAVGAIGLRRAEVNPFTDKQITLLETFAAQAVIAIENTRLLNELRQRTNDLTESLEQQTATSKVLGVISSSPGDLQPVFASMLENAVRICDAKFGNIYRWEDDALHLVASHNTPPAFAQARRRSPFRRADAGELVINRMLATKTAIHVADVAAQPGYIDRSDHGAVAAVELGGVRTVLAVPMLRENELIGSFTVYRQEVRPFTDKQIALVTNFAAQAVIAIENTRLLNELRESLLQQTATADVAESGQPLDLRFNGRPQHACRVCGPSVRG
jgi:two-component system, NtrC family, sensor kinase